MVVAGKCMRRREHLCRGFYGLWGAPGGETVSCYIVLLVLVYVSAAREESRFRYPVDVILERLG